MADIIISKPNAEIKDIGDTYEDNENVLRIWCCLFPNSYALQIRSHNPLHGKFSKGKDRNFIATVYVSIDELEGILNEMKAYRDGQPSIFNRKE